MDATENARASFESRISVHLHMTLKYSKQSLENVLHFRTGVCRLLISCQNTGLGRENYYLV